MVSALSVSRHRAAASAAIQRHLPRGPLHRQAPDSEVELGCKLGRFGFGFHGLRSLVLGFWIWQ